MGLSYSKMNKKALKKETKKLITNKNIEVTINTNIIKKYIKTVLFLGSSFNDHISKYLKINKININLHL